MINSAASWFVHAIAFIKYEGVGVLSDPEYLRNSRAILLVRQDFVGRGRINFAVSRQTSTNNARLKSSTHCSGGIPASARHTHQCVIKPRAELPTFEGSRGLFTFGLRAKPCFTNGRLKAVACSEKQKETVQISLESTPYMLWCFLNVSKHWNCF